MTDDENLLASGQFSDKQLIQHLIRQTETSDTAQIEKIYQEFTSLDDELTFWITQVIISMMLAFLSEFKIIEIMKALDVELRSEYLPALCIAYNAISYMRLSFVVTKWSVISEFLKTKMTLGRKPMFISLVSYPRAFRFTAFTPIALLPAGRVISTRQFIKVVIFLLFSLGLLCCLIIAWFAFLYEVWNRQTADHWNLVVRRGLVVLDCSVLLLFSNLLGASNKVEQHKPSPSPSE